jgi:hypothetical protein
MRLVTGTLLPLAEEPLNFLLADFLPIFRAFSHISLHFSATAAAASRLTGFGTIIHNIDKVILNLMRKIFLFASTILITILFFFPSFFLSFFLSFILSFFLFFCLPIACSDIAQNSSSIILEVIILFSYF